MPRLARDFDPLAARDVASPNLVAGRTRDVPGYALFVRTETETVGQTFARTGELAGISPIEVHAEGLANFVADDLHEHSLIVEQQLRRIERRHPIARSDFFQRTGIEIVNPKVRRSLRVIFLEGPAQAVASRFHAKEQ